MLPEKSHSILSVPYWLFAGGQTSAFLVLNELCYEALLLCIIYARSSSHANVARLDYNTACLGKDLYMQNDKLMHELCS